MDNQRVTFVNGEATITVPDSYFIPKEITTTETDFPVTLDMVILDNRGNEVQVPCDPFTIEIPQAQASEMNPAYRYLRNQRSQLDAVLQVFARQYHLPQRRTAYRGYFKWPVLRFPALELGENIFALEVRAPYKRGK